MKDYFNKLLKNEYVDKIISFISLQILAKIHWNSLKALVNGGVYWDLKEADHDYLRKALTYNYYFILTYRKTHLTSYLINLGNLITTGKWTGWTHFLMNVENEVFEGQGFKIMEATGKGVHYSTFMEVFDCDSVSLLKPRNLTIEDWTLLLDKAKDQYGKPYNTLFDLTNETEISCVQLGLEALRSLPDYQKHFSSFEAMIQKYGNLTPQMYYDCPDFEIVWEVRR